MRPSLRLLFVSIFQVWPFKNRDQHFLLAYWGHLIRTNLFWVCWTLYSSIAAWILQKAPFFLLFLNFFFTGNVQHHLFFFCHPIAAAPLPNLFPACSSLSKPFIMTAIHNTSPSAGFYFPCRPVTASSSYPTASPRLSLSLTLSPPWPLRSQRIHSLPFVSAQSKQAATEGRASGWEREG